MIFLVFSLIVFVSTFIYLRKKLCGYKSAGFYSGFILGLLNHVIYIFYLMTCKSMLCSIQYGKYLWVFFYTERLSNSLVGAVIVKVLGANQLVYILSYYVIAGVISIAIFSLSGLFIGYLLKFKK